MGTAVSLRPTEPATGTQVVVTKVPPDTTHGPQNGGLLGPLAPWTGTLAPWTGTLAVPLQMASGSENPASCPGAWVAAVALGSKGPHPRATPNPAESFWDGSSVSREEPERPEPGLGRG